MSPTSAAQGNLAVDQGALIVTVTPNDPAGTAGLQAGDLIVQVDTKPVTGAQALSDALLSKNPGDTAAVTVYRGKQQMTVNVKLGELQAGG